MKPLPSLSTLLAGVALGAVLLVFGTGDARSQEGEADMAKMMELWKKFNDPGPQHELLERFVGDFETTTTVVGQSPEAGRAQGSWKLGRRFVEMEGKGSMMGMPVETITLIGYDNFKQSYVTTYVSSMETAMRHAEGDATRTKDALISYGTLDEYLTGENDKMVKYVYRFPSDDVIVLEVHDLPIGETDTKVVEVRFQRIVEKR